MATGTAVAVRESSSIAALDEFDSILQGEKAAAQIETDPVQIQKEITARILAATSDEELQNFGNAVPWQELADVPVEIHGFRYRPSDFKEGAPVFVVVDATRLDDGGSVTLTTGGYNIMAQLSNLARRDRFPSVWMLTVSEKATAAGFHPLWLTQPDAARVDLARAMADDSNPLDEV